LHLFICPLNGHYNLRIIERRNYLLSQIEEVRRTRSLQRAARKRHGGSNGQGLATVAVIGYTNAVGGLNLIILAHHGYYECHLNNLF
jgi:50S ribosomal subunit-associated GTPase HflX